MQDSQDWEIEYRFFDRIDLFCDQMIIKIDSIMKKIESRLSIFCKDQQDQFTHCQSFLEIHGIDHGSWLIFFKDRSAKINWCNSIFLIFFKDRREQFDNSWSFLKIEKIDRSKIDRST